MVVHGQEYQLIKISFIKAVMEQDQVLSQILWFSSWVFHGVYGDQIFKQLLNVRLDHVLHTFF